MAVFESIDFWRDETPRTGAENMAVDQLLMERVGKRHSRRPLLRVYEWSEPTVTFGYFLPLSDATDAFPDEGLTYVRRWTGGGVVDHRVDITYTLAIPREHPLATARGAESYRVIHQALAETFTELGQAVRLTEVDEGEGAAACFANPVAYDLTRPDGEKVAGAGQRRTRFGLLHQGSVIAEPAIDPFAAVLTDKLAFETKAWSADTALLAAVDDLAAERYASADWLAKKLLSATG